MKKLTDEEIMYIKLRENRCLFEAGTVCKIVKLRSINNKEWTVLVEAERVTGVPVQFWVNQRDCEFIEPDETPEETEYERACRLWDEWQREPGGGITYEAALQIVPPILDEITRLKASAWTREDLVNLGEYLKDENVEIYEMTKVCWLVDEWIAKRLAGKGAE